MSNEHNHHHDESKHEAHGKTYQDPSAPLFETMVKRGIWVVYPLLGLCFLHVLWLMNDRMDNIMYNTVAIHEKPAPFVDIRTPVAGSVMKGMDLKLIKEPSADMLKNGKAVFQDKCVMCHGAEGKGDGAAGGGKARNFHSKDNWKNGRELSKMFGTITKGTDGGMPAFDTLPVETRISLIHYVRNFTKDYPEIKDSEVEDLDKQFNLSKETVNPHKIPVKLAVQLKIAEAKELNDRNHQLTEKISKDQSEHALLLKSYTDNLEKTVNSFQSNTVWKKDTESFVKFLTVNIGVNGVKSEVLLLEKEKLENLYAYLKDVK